MAAPQRRWPPDSLHIGFSLFNHGSRLLSLRSASRKFRRCLPVLKSFSGQLSIRRARLPTRAIEGFWWAHCWLNPNEWLGCLSKLLTQQLTRMSHELNKSLKQISLLTSLLSILFILILDCRSDLSRAPTPKCLSSCNLSLSERFNFVQLSSQKKTVVQGS